MLYQAKRHESGVSARLSLVGKKRVFCAVHDTLGVLLILLVLGHVYLAVFINPGALGAVFEGRGLGAPRIGPGGP
jgi:hypothetical protein